MVRGKTKLNPYVSGFAVIGMIVLAMFVFSFGPFAASVTPFTDGVPGVAVLPTPTGQFCSSETTPDIDLNTYDSENVGTALTEAENIYRKVGATAWNQFTAGTEITDLEAFATYEYVLGIDVDDWTDNNYGPYGTFTVKCQPDETIDVGVYNDDIETELTGTFYNDDDNAAAQAIAADESKIIRLKWTASSDEVYGNPFIIDTPAAVVNPDGTHRKAYPNMLALKINTTHGDKPDYVKIQETGEEMKAISCGNIITTATGFQFYCYEAPVMTETPTNLLVSYNSDDSYDPTADDTAYLYASNIYVDSDDGLVKWGNENEDDAALGADAADSITIDLS